LRFPGTVPDVAAFTAHGRAVAWLSDDNSVRLTEIATGKELRRFTGHRGAVQELAVTDDGALLASRGSDATAVVWSLAGLDRDMRPRNTVRRTEELDGL